MAIESGGSRRAGRDIFERLWDGKELNGRTILLHSEQGFGDAIHFSRYISMVIDRGGRVIVQIQKDLIRLLQQVAGVEKWIAKGEAAEFDVQCPLLSLPGLFGTRVETIPAQKGLLVAEEGGAEIWRGRLEKTPGRMKVGLAWAGNPTHKKDRSRSIPLSRLAPLAKISNIVFHSIQKGEAAKEALEGSTEMRIVDWAGQLGDFADTAGLIANLDLIITVDTAVAHLAGAMGKPVWLMLPFMPDWRWMLGRGDSPWYPSMRLFRQPSRGDWEAVIRQVSDALGGQLPMKGL